MRNRAREIPTETGRQRFGEAEFRPLWFDIEKKNLGQPEPEAAGTAIRDGKARIEQPAPYARTTSRRAYLHDTRAASAAAALPRLPEPGETLHGWMNASWDALHFVPRLRTLAGCRIAELNIATLGFNKENIEGLLELVDADAIYATVLCSNFYKTHEGDLVEMLTRELERRGGRMAAARCHAKVICVELEDGRCFDWRSSSNLRTCHNLEQFDLTHDRGLVEYDRAVLLDLMGKVGA